MEHNDFFRCFPQLLSEYSVVFVFLHIGFQPFFIVFFVDFLVKPKDYG